MGVEIVEDRTVRFVIAYVESESKEGVFYKVGTDGVSCKCSCPAGQNGRKCKHFEMVKKAMEG